MGARSVFRCVLGRLLIAELCGRAAFDFGKNAAEIVSAAKAELIGNLLDGEVRAAQQDFGPRDLGVLYIAADAESRFFFETAGQVIFRIAGEFRQIFCADFFAGVHFDIIPAAGDGGRKLWILSDPVHPADEIVVHQRGDAADFVVS